MAFNTGANNNNNSNNNNDSWKAQGFLNFYLPSVNGERRKLGAIPLKADKPNEKLLLDWLTEDPTRVANILAKLIIEFNPAIPDASTAFDLS